MGASSAKHQSPPPSAHTVATELGGNVGKDTPGVPGLGRRAAVEDPNGINLMLIELKT
jgi:predicted enzyme related to lactoylglutathione lyase